MSATPERATRRTQAARTAATVDLIVNATLDAIAEVGLRNTTTGEISRRAGVSIGALFHHFETRLDIIVAAVEHNLEQRFARVSSVADTLRRDVPTDSVGGADPRALIGTLRAIAREPRSMVWIEVFLESRTDPALRDRVAPILARQRDRFRAAASLEPGLKSMDPLDRLTWVELLRNVIAGESIWESVRPRAEHDESKLDALLVLATDLNASPTPARESRAAD